MRRGIGGSEFLARILDMHNDMVIRAKRPEDVAFRRVEGEIKPEEVVEVVADVFGMKTEDLGKRQYACDARAVVAQMLVKCAGMNQRDIGVKFGMGPGLAVYQQLKKISACRKGCPEMDARMKKIEITLEKCATEYAVY